MEFEKWTKIRISYAKSLLKFVIFYGNHIILVISHKQHIFFSFFFRLFILMSLEHSYKVSNLSKHIYYNFHIFTIWWWNLSWSGIIFLVVLMFIILRYLIVLVAFYVFDLYFCIISIGFNIRIGVRRWVGLPLEALPWLNSLLLRNCIFI